MSLIFEALKKLDREKQAPERGFLVVGAGSWAGGRRARAIPIVLALVAASVAGFFVAQWLARRAPSAPAALAPASVAPQSPPPATFEAPYLPPAASARTAPPASEPIAAPPAGAASTDGPAPARLPGAPEPAAVRAARAAAEAAAEVTYTLQAVTQQDGQPVAIVNGQLVRVGDQVEGARVIRIEADAVEIEKDGRRIVLGF